MINIVTFRIIFFIIWFIPMFSIWIILNFVKEINHSALKKDFYISSAIPILNIFVLLELIFFQFINKGVNMNFKNNPIDNVLNKKKQVEELEKKLSQEKEIMNKMKSIAKKDLEWILGE